MLAHPQQGVDHRVAGDFDLVDVHPFAQQVVARGLGGREMQVGDHRGQAAVGLLRPGLVDVAGTQAGLNVAHRNLPVEGREGGNETGGGIAVHQHDVRTMTVVAVIEFAHHLQGQAVQRLALGHDVEVFIDLQFEGVQHLL